MKELKDNVVLDMLPTLTTPQKLALRDQQVKVLALRNNGRDLIEKAREEEAEFQKAVNKMAVDMHVDLTKFGFNPDTLEFFLLNKNGAQ